ncbi:Protein CBG27711 [Caenorhabditis briggsae]|uniref:Protein CBG27711 n=1 Tax=Caenorhabditis briggsae TaxID=6238 RepID=B6IJ09_CAEBR|nr:Protein CBG27711 [Caenorhabditis briggsae]CAR99989.1 Protein CBG27711 [Caenorhabditis briggsae]
MSIIQRENFNLIIDA